MGLKSEIGEDVNVNEDDKYKGLLFCNRGIFRVFSIVVWFLH